MLVWVASYPRSGNTLTLLVLRDAFDIPRLGADFREELDLGRLPARALPGGTPRAWRLPSDLRGLTGDALLDALRARPETYFIKTHRVERAGDPAPALYLVRDGRDALVSHAHFVGDNDEPRFRDRTFDQRLAKLIKPGIPAQGGWSGNVRAWRARVAPTATLRFEDLVTDPVAVVAVACRSIGVPLPEPVASPEKFDRLHELSPLIFRRGESGVWEEEMSPRLQKRFWAAHGPEMNQLGYTRDPVQQR